jgi:FAD/FMN-containing dehydrogenase
MVELESWGRRRQSAVTIAGEGLAVLARRANLARGLGRAYGDANLPAAPSDVVLTTGAADRILDFAPEQRRVTAEAGISLEELNRILWPAGLSVPVSPGTKFVTLGGMIAADVHGKNHHLAGTIGRHVARLELVAPDGATHRLSPEEDAELFWATVGGMGLTGVILSAELELEAIPTPWVRCEISRHATLEELGAALVEAGRRWPLTAAWLDAANPGTWGRGVVLAGRWAEPHEAPDRPPAEGLRVPVPLDAPSWLLTDLAAGLFDRLYWRRAPRRPTVRTLHPDAFFYPLDAVLGWNRLYGRRGFAQYQCVIPASHGIAGVRRVLDALRESGGRSYLVVLKDFGAAGPGLLSFPQPGFTLALDLPADPRLVQVARRLDQEVLRLGGRLYLAKDGLLDAETFRAMEGQRLEPFLEVRRRVDPHRIIRSALAQRLQL